MSASRSSAIALHVEAAKRLLGELEQHSATALGALGRDSGSDFFAAVEERDHVLEQLNTVVEALAHERHEIEQPGAEHDDRTGALLAEMARAAAAALESHENLVARTQQERDRLAGALQRTNRADSVADQYAVASSGVPQRTLSVRG
ncbi:MAG: hypothetical protein JWM41_4672 [Gemmatimonadetes bacterium]|nr:hypothetical protein [Gemmatimonadota bacterium]